MSSAGDALEAEARASTQRDCRLLLAFPFLMRGMVFTKYTRTGASYKESLPLYPKGCTMSLSDFVKEKRKTVKLTQPELAEKAGVGLRFIRELEQGKETLRLDKVNQVLQLFGYEVGAVPQIRLSES